MKIYLFFLIFLFPTHFFLSQTSVSGTVFNENEIPLSGVLIVNVNTDKQTFTDLNGNFVIAAISGNELRFMRQNYERVSLKINLQNINSSLNVELKYLPKDIETVVLNYKPTGNLKEDIKHYGPSKKDVKLNQDLGKYIHTPSSREVLKAKPGEFVQPKGPGFETTKIGYQWTITDLQIKLEEAIPKDYFKSLGLKDSEIFAFIGFTLNNFDTKEMRRFGRITSSDLARFQIEAEKQIVLFKKKN